MSGDVLFPAVPDHVGLSDVRRIEAATRECRALDYRQGGGVCRDTVSAHLVTCRPLLDAMASDTVRTRLQVAIADLHNLAGWTYFDTGQVAAAHTQFQQALTLARHAAHHDLAANICYRLGRVHLHHHEPADALSLFQLAELLADRADPARTVALVRANQAWAYATMGTTGEALRLLAAAHDTFATLDSEDTAPAPWAAFFDRTDLAALTGTVLTELARHTDPRHTSAAIPALTTAVTGYDDDMARSRTICTILLATCHLIDGDLDHGLDLGHHALTTAQALASPRTLDRLAPLTAETHRHRHHPDVDTLAHHLNTTRPRPAPQNPSGTPIRERACDTT